jgi:hypothetical protein
MKIDLLLHSVTQDQESKMSNDPFYGWMHGPASGGDGCGFEKFSFRKEDWGSVFIYGSTQQVFITDIEGYEFLVKLKDGEALNLIRPTSDEFVAKLNEFGIR